MTEKPVKMRGRAWLRELGRFCGDCLPPAGVMAELGSFAGESTRIFASHAGSVYAVDTWDESYSTDVFDGCANTRITSYLANSPIDMRKVEQLYQASIAGFDNVVTIKEDAETAASRFADSTFDLVYVDTVHTFEVVSRLIGVWLPKLKTGGVMSGHDYDRSLWPGVCAAVDERFGAPQGVYGDTTWWVRV